MSSISEAIKTYLETQVPSAGQSFPLEVPQEATGWSYYVVSDQQVLAHDRPTNFYKARIQIDLVAAPSPTQSAYLVALGLRKQMRDKLDGYKGAMSDVQVEYCLTEISDEWADVRETPSTRFDILINYKL